MKWLASLVLGTTVSLSAFAEVTKKNAKLPVSNVPSQTTAVVQKEAALEKSSFDKFYDRLGITYAATLTTPTLEDWDTRNAAISPQWGDTGRGCRKNCDTYAMNVFNQFNISYNFGAKMKFNIIPRFTVYLDNPKDMNQAAGEDRAMIGIEDSMVGFSGTIYSSDDKKFSWWLRTALRLPTSLFNRNVDNGDFGHITYQPDINNTFSYQLTEKLSLGLALINRFWVHEDRYNQSRHRIITNPNITYSMTDKTQLMLGYENIIENNKNYESVNGKGLKYYDMWQMASVGVNHDFEKFSLNPYLGVFVDDIPLSMRSTFIGLSFSASLK